MARDIGLAILSGLLGGVGRIGPAIQHARDVEMAERKQRVQEEQLAEQQRFHTESLAQQRVPAELLRTYGAEIPETTPFVPAGLAGELIRIGQSRTRGREAAASIRGGPSYYQGGAPPGQPLVEPFRPGEPIADLPRMVWDERMGRWVAAPGLPEESFQPVTVGTPDPKQALLATLLESGVIGSGDTGPLFKMLFPETDPFTLGPGQQRFEPGGSLIATGQPALPVKATEGEERRGLIDRVLRDKGYRPGTPEYNEQFLNATRTYPVPEGGQLFGGGQIIPPARPPAPRAAAPSAPLVPSAPAPPAPPEAVPGQPGGPLPLAAGSPRPLEAASAQLLVGAAQARASADKVLEALKDPATLNYIGPYAHYLSEAQRRAPYQALGEIPPAVIALEQNLARVQNHTIKLITGAQMSEHEAVRIQAELPQTWHQPQEFRQRVLQTLENIKMMEEIVQGLLQRPGRQVPAAPRPAAPSPVVPQQRPTTGGVIRYERDPMTGKLRPLP